MGITRGIVMIPLERSRKTIVIHAENHRMIAISHSDDHQNVKRRRIFFQLASASLFEVHLFEASQRGDRKGALPAAAAICGHLRKHLKAPKLDLPRPFGQQLSYCDNIKHHIYTYPAIIYIYIHIQHIFLYDF